MRSEIPFRLRGKSGKVTIEYGINEDPERWGYDLLDLPYEHGISEGFPVVRASVEYAGEGYGAAMAWVQIIHYRIGTGEEQVEIDQPPQLSGSGIPYCCWGPNPSFFDAPSMTNTEAVWTADTFLTATPDAVMSRVVRPVCGFRWGFTISSGRPESTPLSPATPWETARTLLAHQFPEWTFEPSP